MDDNISWKFLYAGVIFSLFVLGLAYWLIAARTVDYTGQSVGEKVAEFKEMRLAGHKEGKRSWSFNVSRGWVSKNREFTFLEDVKNGTVYRDDRPVITNLRAPQMRVFQGSDILEAIGTPEAVRANLNFGRLGKESKDNWAALSADYMRMRPNDKQTEINGHVTLSQKNSLLLAGAALINHQEKWADFSNQVSFRKKNLSLNSETARFLSGEEKFEANGAVRIRIVDKPTTSIVKANRADFFIDEKKAVPFWGTVEVVQKHNLATANEGIYSRTAKELTLRGGVKSVFQKASDAIDDQTAAKVRGPEAKAILKEKTFLTSNELVFSTQTGNARASGNVEVSQNGREAKADQGVFDDKADTLVLTGNVFLKKKDKWVKARQVDISIEKETFEAHGSVEAEFKI